VERRSGTSPSGQPLSFVPQTAGDAVHEVGNRSPRRCSRLATVPAHRRRGREGTYGGVLALSEQAIDWTDPSLLGLVIQDLAAQYAIQTESVLTSAIEAAVTTNKAVLSLTAASDVFLAAIARQR